MRVVLDTNVLISAVISRGTPRQLFDLWREQHAFDLVVCPLLVDEFVEVLLRERFRSLVSREEVGVLAAFLRNEAELVDDPVDVPAVVRDRDDDFLVALALSGDADILVSGDQDLLALNHPSITVVRPVDALARLSQWG